MAAPVPLQPPDPLLAISGATALAGVLGQPVRHSLSPAMHNAALRALGLDWVYLALPVPSEGLETVVHALELLDCRGLNVTLPHKQAVCGLAAELSPLAQRLGAVNTLVRRPQGGWFGTNTDVSGFLAPLRAEGECWSGRRALVLGTGGSARAVLAGLLELGLEQITLAGRRPEPLAALLAAGRRWQADADPAAVATRLEAVAWQDLGAATGAGADAVTAALDGCELLVNTTPVGMASAQDPTAAQRSPLRRDQLDHLAATATIYDLIYTPRPTALLAEAGARGCRCLDGLEMLVQQGAAALRLWTGRKEVPVAAMRQAALAQLTGR
ncbi:MAG: shikimate dehydrogenase [Synechococcaceae cyanobacterium]|nr:shikimate dehydrogenase [Synechococcaceae cyanobacterium]